MGSPLSPALADLVMETLLDNVLKMIDFPIPFFKKYVDDLITAVPADKIEHVKNALNAYNTHIQFTCEVENENRLPYLDMILIRTSEQRIVTDWYMKSVSSGRILNFFSLHPLTQKLNTATGFISRVFRLSTCKTLAEKKKTVRGYLSKNNYPIALINRLMNRFSNENANISNNVNIEPKVYRSLHHVDSLTPALAKVIHRNFKNVTLSFKCAKTNSILFSKLKDATSKLQRRNIIYRVSCIECAHTYIGLTTQQLKQRMAGHRSLIKRYEEFKRSGSFDSNKKDEFKKTALMVHMIENDHNFDLPNVTILDQDNRIQALQILEMCHIFTDKTTINFRTDTNNLNVAYSGMLHSLSR